MKDEEKKSNNKNGGSNRTGSTYPKKTNTNTHTKKTNVKTKENTSNKKGSSEKKHVNSKKQGYSNPQNKQSTNRKKGPNTKKTNQKSKNDIPKQEKTKKKIDLEKTQILTKEDINTYKDILLEQPSSGSKEEKNNLSIDNTIVISESKIQESDKTDDVMADIFSNTTKIDFKNIKNDLNLEQSYNQASVQQKKDKNIKFILSLLLSLGLIIFIIVHFITVNHNKVVIKEKVVTPTILNENYIFLGDSLTHRYDLKKYFSNKPVVNSGEDGYKTTDLIERLDEMVYEYNPSKVFILIGTNDLTEENFDINTIVDNIKEITQKIKKNRPHATLYIESLYPVDSERVKNRNNKDIQEINKLLKQICKDENMTYIDIHSILKDESGDLKKDYTEDGIHINESGYQKITDTLNKYLK